jgi:hypothetical protein
MMIGKLESLDDLAFPIVNQSIERSRVGDTCDGYNFAPVQEREGKLLGPVRAEA